MKKKKSAPWDRLRELSANARRNYTFNTLSAAMSAVMMLLLQLLTTRVLGAEAAGRVSVDAATVLLCFHIGQLNMRPVQCTDLRERFSFSEYLTLKSITVALMLAICLVYVFARGYDAKRGAFCMAFCAFKALEAVSDCFWGMLQQKGRIDLAGLGGAMYHFTAITAFAVVLFASENLAAAALAMALAGAANLLLYTLPLSRYFDKARLSRRFGRIGRLVAVLVPLFAAGYFLNLAITLPKYALERYGSETAQGHFAAMYMTAQGVLLLCSFLYYPQLTVLARHAAEGDVAGFLRRLARLGAAIVLIDLAVAAGGWLVGTELLGLLFGLTLTPYRPDLLLILFGGGFFALYTLTSYALIAMREQKGLWLLTLCVLALSALLNAVLVPRALLRGAALSYLLMMIAAAILAVLKLMRALRRRKEGEGENAAAS